MTGGSNKDFGTESPFQIQIQEGPSSSSLSVTPVSFCLFPYFQSRNDKQGGQKTGGFEEGGPHLSLFISSSS